MEILKLKSVTIETVCLMCRCNQKSNLGWPKPHLFWF